jgi:hypothetical protein
MQGCHDPDVYITVGIYIGAACCLAGIGLSILLDWAKSKNWKIW